MDIWDSLRAIRRHWIISLPVLVLGVLASAYIYSISPTTWDVQTSSILLGPSQVSRTVNGELVIEDQNQYFEAGVAMPLTRVLILALKDPEVIRQLEEDGLSTDFTQEWDNRQPLITTRVSAESADIAVETARRLLDLTAAELESRQANAQVAPLERAVQDELSFSIPRENFETPRLYFAVGFLLTVIATAGSALAREWYQRRDEYASEVWVPNEDLPGEYTVVSAVPDHDKTADAADEDPAEPSDEDASDGKSSRWQRRAAN